MGDAILSDLTKAPTDQTNPNDKPSGKQSDFGDDKPSELALNVQAWLRRVCTEVVYPCTADENVAEISVDRLLQQEGGKKGTANFMATDVFAVPAVRDYAIPMSFWFLSRVCRSTQLGDVVFMPTDWSRDERHARAVVRLGVLPNLIEAVQRLQTLLRSSCPHLRLEYFTAPTRVLSVALDESQRLRSPRECSQFLGPEYTAGVEVFERALDTMLEWLDLDARMKSKGVSGKRCDQLALLRDSTRRRLLQGMRQLFAYRYDEEFHELTTVHRKSYPGALALVPGNLPPAVYSGTFERVLRS